LLLQYPEDASLGSLAARVLFKVSFLDQFPPPHILYKAGSPPDLYPLMRLQAE
jgi:hypothetical protein